MVSCNSIPEDIYLFLKETDEKKAMEAVNTASVSYEMEIHSTADEENLGSMTFQLKMDKSKKQDYFCYYEENFYGNSVLLDEESHLYVEFLSSHTYFDGAHYLVETYKRGHKEGQEETEEFTSTSRHLPSEEESLYSKIFYRGDNGYVLTNGLFYADMMKAMLKYVVFMRVEGDQFIYQYDKLYYKSDTEEGWNSCKAVMDKIGMLLTEETSAKNYTKELGNSSSLVATYNEEVTRDLSFD